MTSDIWMFSDICNLLVFLYLTTLLHPLGFEKGRAVDLCQQAGCERLHVCGRDLPEPPAYLCQRPPVAHSGLLRTHWGGVRAAFISFYTLLINSVLKLQLYSLVLPLCAYRDLILTPVHLHSCPLLFHGPIPLCHSQCLLYPAGCARVSSGWCHDCAWDDDLWLWSGARPRSLFSLPPELELEMRTRGEDLSPLSCEADMGRPLPGPYVLLW